MTIYAFEAQETWLPTVVGRRCSVVEVDDALLRLHFGTIHTSQDGMIDAERTISMYGVWRVEHGDEIVAGSGDHEGRDVPPELATLVGATLERFNVNRPGFDLDLIFSGGFTARSFPCDSSEFAEDVAEDVEDYPISWWVDGDGVSDDWEEPYDPQGA